MSDWSEVSEKVLCYCGAVTWTKTKTEGDKVIMKDSCLSCGKTDQVEEIGSTEKMSRKKAQKIVESFCDIVEMNPFEIMGGRLTHDAGTLAQHLEDVGRIKAAARIRKGVEAIKGGFLKQVTAMMPQKPTEEAKKFILKASAFPPSPSSPSVQMLPGCAKCNNAVMDWTQEMRWTVAGYFCATCRTNLRNSEKAQIVSAHVERSITFARETLARSETILAEIKAFEPYDPPDPV